MINQYFDDLNKFLGAGNKNAKVWFFGIEDGGLGWKNDKETRDQITKMYAGKSVCEMTEKGIEECSWPVDANNIKKRGTIIYYYMSYIMSRLEPFQGKEGREYWSVLGSHILHINIYPLKKARSANKLPSQYQELFGLDSLDYPKEPICNRLQMLKKAWQARQENAPHVAICFGINNNHLQTIRDLFDLNTDEEKVERLRGNAKIYCYPTSRIFVTPFFGQCGPTNGGALKYSELNKMIDAIKHYFENPLSPLCFGE